MAWGISVREQSQGRHWHTSTSFMFRMMGSTASAIAYKSTWGGGRLLRRPGGVDGHIPFSLTVMRSISCRSSPLVMSSRGEDAADLLRDLRLQIPGRVPRQPVQILPEAGAPLRQEPQPPAQFLHGEQIAGVELQIAGTLALQLVQTAPESGGRVPPQAGRSGRPAGGVPPPASAAGEEIWAASQARSWSSSPSSGRMVPLPQRLPAYSLWMGQCQ